MKAYNLFHMPLQVLGGEEQNSGAGGETAPVELVLLCTWRKVIGMGVGTGSPISALGSLFWREIKYAFNETSSGYRRERGREIGRLRD